MPNPINNALNRAHAVLEDTEGYIHADDLLDCVLGTGEYSEQEQEEIRRSWSRYYRGNVYGHYRDSEY